MSMNYTATGPVGELVNTSQPSFLVSRVSGDNVTDMAVGTLHYLAWGATEVWDQGADFATPAFTAPVTGKYQLNVMCQLNKTRANQGYYDLRLYTSNTLYQNFQSANQNDNTGLYDSFQCSMLVDMDASDTANVAMYMDGGTAATDLVSGGGSWFGGFLVH